MRKRDKWCWLKKRHNGARRMTNKRHLISANLVMRRRPVTGNMHSLSRSEGKSFSKTRLYGDCFFKHRKRKRAFSNLIGGWFVIGSWLWKIEIERSPKISTFWWQQFLFLKFSTKEPFETKNIWSNDQQSSISSCSSQRWLLGCRHQEFPKQGSPRLLQPLQKTMGLCVLHHA